MRILHTADWHLGRALEGRSRQDEQEQFIDELCDIVEKENVDVVLMAGDAFDSVNPPAAAEQLFYEGMARLANKGRRKVIAIAGNHDNPDRLAASGPLATEHGITLIGKPINHTLEMDVPSTGQTLSLAALPYPSEARLNELLSSSDEEEVLQQAYDKRIARLFESMTAQFRSNTVNIAMSHLYVGGGLETESERPIQIGGAYTVFENSLPETAQYVALGHLHRPQNISGANTPVRYSGSPLAYSFSESSQAKSVTLLDVQPGEKAEMSEIFLSCGKPLVQWKATEGMSQVYRWINEEKDTNAWIDLEIHLIDTPSMEEIHRLRKSHPGFIHIRPVFPEEEGDPKERANRNVPIDELFRSFYQKQTGGAAPGDELTKLFLEIVEETYDEAE
jgi:exonuclease SbcD